MTERQKDERDLSILAQYEVGTPKAELMRQHGVSKSYVYRLIKEALYA
jgi:Mor family transcriptional regulator